MPALDLNHFAKSDPYVLAPGTDLNKIRYADLFYDSRLCAVVRATRDNGKPMPFEPFNDLVNGRRSVQYVMDYLDARLGS